MFQFLNYFVTHTYFVIKYKNIIFLRKKYWNDETIGQPIVYTCQAKLSGKTHGGLVDHKPHHKSQYLILLVT